MYLPVTRLKIMEAIKCFVCVKPATTFKVNLDLCPECIEDFNELLKYCGDTANIKRKFKKYRKKMQDIIIESVEPLKRREISTIAWKVFSKTFESKETWFSVGRSYEDSIYFSIYAAGRMKNYLIMLKDMIKNEPLSFKRSFIKRFYKNFYVFKNKILNDIGYKNESISIKTYLDVLIRKLKPNAEKRNIIMKIYDLLGKEDVLSRNFSVDDEKQKRIESNVAAANIYYIATKELQKNIADAIYITTVPIQKHYKKIESIVGQKVAHISTS